MKIPQAYISAGAKAEITTKTDVLGSQKVEARINMSAEVAGAGLCPDCGQPMETIMAGPVETQTCMPCRISLPLPDAPDAAVL